MNMNRRPIPTALARLMLAWPCSCDDYDGFRGVPNWNVYCPRHGDPALIRTAERRANLLAGLNDAPTALTGWNLPDDRRHRRIRLRGGGYVSTVGWGRLDGMQFKIGTERMARNIVKAIGGVLGALTGRPPWAPMTEHSGGVQSDYALAPDSNRK